MFGACDRKSPQLLWEATGWLESKTERGYAIEEIFVPREQE